MDIKTEFVEITESVHDNMERIQTNTETYEDLILEFSKLTGISIEDAKNLFFGV